MRYELPIPQEAPEAGRVILKDGTVAQLRPCQATDREALVRFFARLTPEALARRFFGVVRPEVAAEAILRSAQLPGAVCLLVCVGPPAAQRIVAVGNSTPVAGDAEAAEVAFVVDEEYRDRGLATLLLERLAILALRADIRRFVARTQADNTAMLDVFAQSGFAIEERREGDLLTVTFPVVPSPTSVDRADLRDKIATVASLTPFFRPRAVAVIGASRDESSIGFRILENLVVHRFQGPVYPVNPRAKVVGSIPAYPSIADVPEPVDLAVIAVPARELLPVVDACGRKGVRALVIITAGLAEVGPEGQQLQRELVALARGYGMRIVGPNCLGLLNTDPRVRLNASFSTVFPPHGRVAMASQSGALGLAILAYARDVGLGVSTFVSVGNKADVSGNDLIQYWEDDPQTDLILLYLESFGNPRRFARLARRVGRNKPILVVKGGRTAAGTRAASSHTAALATSDVAVQALFHQAGVIRADTLEEMFDIAALLARQPLPRGPRVAIVTNAGGPGILAADALVSAGLEVPEPSPELKAKLRAILPPAANVSNPIDMIASATDEAYRDVARLLLQDEGFDALLAIYIPLGFTTPEAVGRALAEASRDGLPPQAAGAEAKPVLACVLQATGTPPWPAEVGIPTYRFPEGAARALGKAHAYATWRRQEMGQLREHPDIRVKEARAIVARAQAQGGGWLGAEDVLALLAAFGLPVLPTRFARNADEAAAAARELGYPVAVKIASRTLVHKTEVQGVQLHLGDEQAVREAVAVLRGRIAALGEAGSLDGFWVQPMAEPGVELMVGVTADPVFGPLIAFGLGGTQVEVVRDVVFRITPLTDRDAAEMVRSIKGYRLLTGYRDLPPADVPAVEDLLLRVSRLVEELWEVTELDLNPVRALAPGKGCQILDARIRVAPPKPTSPQ